MLQMLRQFSTIFSEFLVLVGAMMLISLAAAFGIFRGYGQDVTTTALVFALVAPLLTAVPAFLYFSSRLMALMADNDGLKRAASTDRLTGVLNRQGFNREYRRLLRGLSFARTRGIMFLIVDADHFKKINDTLGHPVGDRALRLISGTLLRSMRGSDVVGRMGGEEFGIAFPCSSLEQGGVVAERLRAAIGGLTVGEGKDCRKLSVSIGGVFFYSASPFDAIYAEADANLYRSKQAGRNRVTLSLMQPRGRSYLRGSETAAVAAPTPRPERRSAVLTSAVAR